MLSWFISCHKRFICTTSVILWSRTSIHTDSYSIYKYTHNLLIIYTHIHWFYTQACTLTQPHAKPHTHAHTHTHTHSFYKSCPSPIAKVSWIIFVFEFWGQTLSGDLCLVCEYDWHRLWCFLCEGLIKTNVSFVDAPYEVPPTCSGGEAERQPWTPGPPVPEFVARMY